MSFREFRLILTLAGIVACAPSQPAPTPTPTQTTGSTSRSEGASGKSGTSSTGPVTEVPNATLRYSEPPANWHLMDPAADGIPGISVERAYRELLAGKQPKETVVVAVIDGGVDTSHADIRPNLWVNPKEKSGNKADDDANGYSDDVRGWNFIGGKDGRDVQYDTYELTRVYAACIDSTGKNLTPKPDAARCQEIAAEFENKRTEAQMTLSQINQYEQIMSSVVSTLKKAMATDTLDLEKVKKFTATGQEVERAKAMYIQFASNGLTEDVLAEAKKAYASRAEYAYNLSLDSRSIVGDNYGDPSERNYGNTDVTGPDAMHGTHVAGIIGGLRGNGPGVDGIATGVKIMSVRTVPDGDERDKDVANAIRYAVDNGAKIINMSFGKGYSPFKKAVDDAVKYADSKGVLMIHAAGNDGNDIDVKESYPTPKYLDGGKPTLWIEVGAISWKGGDSLVAPFSNYGATAVDVFAPGVDILSAVPGGGYERQSGTSMAAPVVAGLAALIMSYYPELTAAQVKQVILTSTVRPAKQIVLRPNGGGEGIQFSALSSTGGIVNAYQALKLAAEMAAKH